MLCCLSAMTALELPHVNVLSKCDLLPSRRALEEFLEADARALGDMLKRGTSPNGSQPKGSLALAMPSGVTFCILRFSLPSK